MDAISALLQPYREAIALTTGLMTVLRMLSGSVLLNDIRRYGAVRPSDSILPFLVGLVLYIIALRLGVALADDTTIRTNLFGVTLHAAYVAFFYWYTPVDRKAAVWTQVCAGGGLAAAVMAYAAWEQDELLAGRLRILLLVLVFTVVSLPFLKLVSGWGELDYCIIEWTTFDLSDLRTKKSHRHRRYIP